MNEDALGWVRRELSIGGAWREGRTGVRLAVEDPATGETFAEVASATAEDGIDAVAAAHAAQPGWARRPPRERSDLLRRVYDLLLRRSDLVAELIVRENGKPLAEARSEVVYAAEFLRWFSEEAVRIEGRVSTAPAGGARMLVLHVPVGVSLLVTPWNFPAAMVTRKVAPALAAGCSVVLKPAPETPLTALALMQLFEEAGLPPGVLNVVPTRDSESLVDAALRDGRVRKLSFTGSTEVGKLLLAKAAGRVIKTSLELGGNAPFIVLAGSDVDAAVEGALAAKMRHSGQTCVAANRFYVEDSVADAFTERLASAMGSLRVGPGLAPETQVGPLVSAEGRSKVVRLVDAALRSGAKLAAGGSAPAGPGFFYPPTVLDYVPATSPILAEEIFGPVAPIVRLRAGDDVVRLANATEHGLVAYLYTGDLARGLRMADALEVGMVGINRGMVSDPAAPFGGIKQSGIGREGSHEGLHAFTELRYVAVSW